ncbi:serine/threonine-protein kinase [Actinoplanes sp. NPDC049599]|uniref:serine/threonine-protein kinase n=1 Tax=Actinoplanes sp. NPDC049599 TaxID=3363903 RepID=UPI003799710F
MLQAGLRLGDRYRLDARIGAGGMGEVWRAVDEVLGRVVAVKAMLPGVADQPDFAKRFLVEATSMASVNHPAVASIHDYGRSAGITFLVMEFVDGESLSQLLARHGRLDPATTMRLVAQAADGLQAVHERGIVHRDIKPANLLVRRDGSLLVTDFGISRTEDGTQLTASGAILGTPTYLSPEQVLGRPATGLSDVYSLGLAAYECLAGRRPFEGDNPYAVALQRVQAAPAALGGDIPGPVLAVVERALATDPADRWPSAAAMAHAARAASGAGRPMAHAAGAASGTGRAVAEPSVGPRSAPEPSTVLRPVPKPAAPRSARRRWALVAAALVVVVTGGAMTWRALGPSGGGGGPAGGADPTNSAAAAAVPAGFVACDAMLCPVEPLCWGGLNATSGRATPPPRDLDCAQTHTWETFAATVLPPDVRGSGEDALLQRKDIAAACSQALLTARTREPGGTKGWDLEAWPIEMPGSRLVHCLATPGLDKAIGSAFSA